MNAGFAAAVGDIVIFLDADDALAPTAVEEVVAAWRPGIAKVQFCLALISAAGRSEALRFPSLRLQLVSCPHQGPSATDGALRVAADQWQCVRAAFPRVRHAAIGRSLPVHDGRRAQYGGAALWRCPFDRQDARLLPRARQQLQNAPVAERIRRGVICKRREAEYLRVQAAALHIDLPADLLHEMIHLEGRIASLKLDRARHPVQNDRLRRLVGPAVRKLWREDERLPRRISHLLWLLTVLISPPRLCERLVAFRFIPGARSDKLCKIMAMLGLVRGQEALENLSPPLAATVSGQAGALETAPRA